MVDTTVKFISYDYQNAPQLTYAPGSLVAILDACLVDGFAATSLTNIVVSNGTATINFPTAHPFKKHSVLKISGMVESALNGQFRANSVLTNSLTFVTTVADGTYTGTTPSAKFAPLGYEIQFQDTNKRIYRPLSVDRNLVSLYVDDSNTNTTGLGWSGTNTKALAYVAAVCDVTGIASFTTLWFTWWAKQNSSNGTTARYWKLVGDRLGFYMHVKSCGVDRGTSVNRFMQLNTYLPGDNYATVLEGYANTTAAPLDGNAIYGPAHGVMSMSFGYTDRKIARGVNQTGAALSYFYACTGVTVQYSSPPYGAVVSGGVPALATAVGYVAQNDPATLGFVACPGVLVISANSARGEMPGLYTSPQIMNGSDSEVFENLPGLGDKALVVLSTTVPVANTTTGTESPGCFYYDITGPWR